MNARRDRFVKPSRRLGGRQPNLRAGAAVGAAALLAGCAGGVSNPFAAAPVDPASPIAAEVARTATTEKTYPSFQDIPKRPTDQRPLKAWGQAAAEVVAAREKLERETAPGNWSLGGTEAFADQAAAAAGRERASNAGADTEAFARAARERATPPPSPR